MFHRPNYRIGPDSPFGDRQKDFQFGHYARILRIRTLARVSTLQSCLEDGNRRSGIARKSKSSLVFGKLPLVRESTVSSQYSLNIPSNAFQ